LRAVLGFTQTVAVRNDCNPQINSQAALRVKYSMPKSLFNIFWQVSFSAKFPFFSVEIPCKAQALLRNFA
jgi:hypothetical protein